MNRFLRHEGAPTRSHYAESLASGRRIARENRRARRLFVCLLPILILTGWGAYQTLEKIFKP